MATTWQNWARFQRCEPAEFVDAGSLDAVRSAVSNAANKGQTVRAAGNGHSFSPVVVTDGCMIALGGMNKLLEADRESGLVRVEAGISIHDLSHALQHEGLALPSLGDIDVQTIAGATATATHGTGAKHTSVASCVESVQLVVATGDVIEIGPGELDDLKAARASVGALGVVTALTLRCVPAFTLDRLNLPVPLDETLDGLPSEPGNWDHWEFYVFPYTRRALEKRIARVDRSPSPPAAPLRFANDVVFENWLLEGVSRLGRRVPRMIPRISRATAKLFSSSRLVDRSYEVFSTVRNVRFLEMEYALPREHAREAVERVLTMVEERKLDVNFPIEVRVGAADFDSYLAAAAQRDTAYVAVHVFNGMQHEPYFRAVEEIMGDYQGRPHWGKMTFLTAEELAPRYPEWDAFQRVRAKLDPSGVFSNDYVNRVLGPVG